MNDSVCTLVYENEGGSQALYAAHGELLTYGDCITAGTMAEVECDIFRIAEAYITEHSCFWKTTHGGPWDPPETDFEWPDQIDEAWFTSTQEWEEM